MTFMVVSVAVGCPKWRSDQPAVRRDLRLTSHHQEIQFKTTDRHVRWICGQETTYP